MLSEDRPSIHQLYGVRSVQAPKMRLRTENREQILLGMDPEDGHHSARTARAVLALLGGNGSVTSLHRCDRSFRVSPLSVRRSAIASRVYQPRAYIAWLAEGSPHASPSGAMSSTFSS